MQSPGQSNLTPTVSRTELIIFTPKYASVPTFLIGANCLQAQEVTSFQSMKTCCVQNMFLHTLENSSGPQETPEQARLRGWMRHSLLLPSQTSPLFPTESRLCLSILRSIEPLSVCRVDDGHLKTLKKHLCFHSSSQGSLLLGTLVLSTPRNWHWEQVVLYKGLQTSKIPMMFPAYIPCFLKKERKEKWKKESLK